VRERTLYLILSFLIERCPLNYKVVRSISCFVPSTILNNRTLSEKRIHTLLQILHDSNNVKTAVTDKAKGQFIKLCSSAHAHACMAEFVCNKHHLDPFYFNLLCTDDDNSEL